MEGAQTAYAFPGTRNGISPLKRGVTFSITSTYCLCVPLFPAVGVPRDSPSTGGIKLAPPRGTCLFTRCSCVSVQGETRLSETVNTSSTVSMRRGAKVMYRNLQSVLGMALCLLVLGFPRVFAADQPSRLLPTAQLPVFSAKYPPVHAPGKGPQSLAGAPLQGDVKGRSGH
jgi:hypothetical protein